MEDIIDYITYCTKAYIKHNNLVRENYFVSVDYDYLSYLKKEKQEELHYLQLEIIKNIIDRDISLSFLNPIAVKTMNLMKNHSFVKIKK